MMRSYTSNITKNNFHRHSSTQAPGDKGRIVTVPTAIAASCRKDGLCPRERRDDLFERECAHNLVEICRKVHERLPILIIEAAQPPYKAVKLPQPLGPGDDVENGGQVR
jgi:hypothetical protein